MLAFPTHHNHGSGGQLRLSDMPWRTKPEVPADDWIGGGRGGEFPFYFKQSGMLGSAVEPIHSLAFCQQFRSGLKMKWPV